MTDDETVKLERRTAARVLHLRFLLRGFARGLGGEIREDRPVCPTCGMTHEGATGFVCRGVRC